MYFFHQQHFYEKKRVMIVATILSCMVVMLFICVVVHERKIRTLMRFSGYSTQTIIPGATIILSSRWYNLFRIPPDLTHDVTGSICLAVNGHGTDDTDVCILLHGIQNEPMVICDVRSVQNFGVDDIFDFPVSADQRGNMIGLRMITSNPGSCMKLSDLVATFILR